MVGSWQCFRSGNRCYSGTAGPGMARAWNGWQPAMAAGSRELHGSRNFWKLAMVWSEESLLVGNGSGRDCRSPGMAGIRHWPAAGNS